MVLVIIFQNESCTFPLLNCIVYTEIGKFSVYSWANLLDMVITSGCYRLPDYTDYTAFRLNLQ